MCPNDLWHPISNDCPPYRERWKSNAETLNTWSLSSDLHQLQQSICPPFSIGHTGRLLQQEKDAPPSQYTRPPCRMDRSDAPLGAIISMARICCAPPSSLGRGSCAKRAIQYRYPYYATDCPLPRHSLRYIHTLLACPTVSCDW